MPDDLETVDFEGVDVLAVGGPYFGTGSPPDGDFYTADELRSIADNTRELLAAGELHAPVKLGHSFDQKLARESGYSDGEMPALGWIDNPRVEGDKLKVDLKKVPKKLGSLFKSGAFRTRSVELKSYVSQRGKGQVGPAIKGLALQGAKAPAVRTLDDIIALYHDEVDEAETQTREYGEMIWNPDLGFRWVQNAISQALNPPNSADARYFVEDIGPTTALVSTAGNANLSVTGGTYVVPFTIDNDKTSIAPASEWLYAQDRWVERAREYADASGERVSPKVADTKVKMELTFTEEQTRELAERHGLDVEAEDFSEQLTAKLFEESGDEGDGDETDKDVVKLPKDELAELKKQAAAGERAEKQLAEMERDTFFEAAEREGKIDPAEREKWERRYEEQPEYTKEIVNELPVREEYLKEYGDDSDGTGRDGRQTDSDKAFAESYLDLLGVGKEGDA